MFDVLWKAPVRSSHMRRMLQALMLTGAITLAAGCSPTTTHRATLHLPTPAASKANATASATPSIRALAPAAKVAAACPLLSADELKLLLGGGTSQTKVTAVEDKPDVTDGYRSYNCKYGSNGTYPFGLGIQDIAQDGYTPKDAIEAITTATKVATRSVTGVGAAGVFYTVPSSFSLLAVSKQSHGETRTVFFTAPIVVPESKFVDVARLVIRRI
jgi:hypothetical protein